MKSDYFIKPTDREANPFKDILPGWNVKVFQKIKEGDKSRVQAFEGTVIARRHGNEAGATITIRKTVGGYAVEKIYPIYLPSVTKVEVLKRVKTRRAKLSYIREKSAREIRKKTRVLQQQEQVG